MATVNGYTTFMDFGDQPHQTILLREDGQQIGALEFSDPALFNATIYMLRNRRHASWDEGRRRLTFALEPIGQAGS